MKLYSTAEAAHELGFNSPQYVRLLIIKGKLHATKKGHSWIVSEADIRKFKGKKDR